MSLCGVFDARVFKVGSDPFRPIAQHGHVIVRSRLQFGFTAYGNFGSNAIAA